MTVPTRTVATSSRSGTHTEKVITRASVAINVHNGTHTTRWISNEIGTNQMSRRGAFEVVADNCKPDATGWVTFADPEGDQFRVERSAAERGKGAAFARTKDLTGATTAAGTASTHT